MNASAINPYFASSGAVDARNHIKQSGFSAAGFADNTYEFTILLTDKDAAMRWGMTAVVTFE